MADYYSKLLEFRRSEGAGRGLSKLPPDFYSQAQSYLADTRKLYETELRENPSGRKGEVARQTHARAQQVARDLIEARTTKILSSAFQAAVGGSRDLPNALPEERALFDRLVETMRTFRQSSAPYLEGAAAAATTVTAPAVAVRPAKATEPAPKAASPGARGSTSVLVRVLKGSPPVEFGGETLELRPEDVLSLSPEQARILVDHQVAELIDAPNDGTRPA